MTAFSTFKNALNLYSLNFLPLKPGTRNSHGLKPIIFYEHTDFLFLLLLCFNPNFGEQSNYFPVFACVWFVYSRTHFSGGHQRIQYILNVENAVTVLSNAFVTSVTGNLFQ